MFFISTSWLPRTRRNLGTPTFCQCNWCQMTCSHGACAITCSAFLAACQGISWRIKKDTDQKNDGNKNVCDYILCVGVFSFLFGRAVTALYKRTREQRSSKRPEQYFTMHTKYIFLMLHVLSFLFFCLSKHILYEQNAVFKTIGTICHKMIEN